MAVVTELSLAYEVALICDLGYLKFWNTLLSLKWIYSASRETTGKLNWKNLALFHVALKQVFSAVHYLFCITVCGMYVWYNGENLF